MRQDKIEISEAGGTMELVGALGDQGGLPGGGEI